MKIYCNRNNKDFEDFLGKDIWVRCVDRFCGEPYYLKIFLINRIKHLLIYYLVKADYVDRIWDIDESTRQKYLQYLQNLDEEGNRCYASINQWKIVRPIETYTTDELIDLFNDIDI